MKSGNYARFYANYARNPGPDPVKLFSLSGGLRRRIMFTDTWGVKVTTWEIAVAKSGGGFVYVNYLNPDTGKPGMKLCYVEPAGDTWLVGSGIYTDRL